MKFNVPIGVAAEIKCQSCDRTVWYCGEDRGDGDTFWPPSTFTLQDLEHECKGDPAGLDLYLVVELT